MLGCQEGPLKSHVPLFTHFLQSVFHQLQHSLPQVRAKFYLGTGRSGVTKSDTALSLGSELTNDMHAWHNTCPVMSQFVLVIVTIKPCVDVVVRGSAQGILQVCLRAIAILSKCE